MGVGTVVRLNFAGDQIMLVLLLALYIGRAGNLGGKGRNLQSRVYSSRTVTLVVEHDAF